MLTTYWNDPNKSTTGGGALQRVCTWANFQRALQKCGKRKAAGIDEFNAYLLRRAPRTVQMHYYNVV